MLLTITEHGVLAGIAIHVAYQLIRYMNSQPRGQPRDARAPSYRRPISQSHNENAKIE
jgi:hypothetical protein